MAPAGESGAGVLTVKNGALTGIVIAALGLTDEQLDGLFVLAATL